MFVCTFCFLFFFLTFPAQQLQIKHRRKREVNDGNEETGECWKCSHLTKTDIQGVHIHTYDDP